VYVLIGGQLLAPQTKAKCIMGPGSGSAIARRGSVFEKGRENDATALRLARRMPLSMSCSEYILATNNITDNVEKLKKYRW
jgi:hypothetical protein